MESELLKKIAAKEHKVAVIGLGYVGLPLAVHLAEAGIDVIGVDIDKQRIEQLKGGHSYILDVPSASYRAVQSRITPTSSYDAVREADVINICVPTPLAKTKDPDISFIIAACQQLKSRLKRGQLVILESTTYPGTTDEIVLPLLAESGLQVGKDYFLAFSPERVDPGNKKFNIKNTPKVVGGITPNCTRVATAFFKSFIDKPVPVSSTRVAEMVKLLENTFRMVNIGLVNELSIMCNLLGVDTWETIDAAATKPFGFLPFYPGPGLGGHCIPVDPYYLSWKLKTLDYIPQFIELAGKINFNMPHHIVERITTGLNSLEKSIKNAKILLLGVSYKENIDDTRESPALDIIELLKQRGAQVSYHDPYVSALEVGSEKLSSCQLTDNLIESCDCVVITTKHDGIDYNNLVDKAKLIIDTRDATRGINSPKVFRL